MVKKKQKLRFIIQALWTLASNSYLAGYANGSIYQGKLKNFCVPGMNCYSCPGALGSCPIGALQSVLGSRKWNFSYYIVGFMIAVGAICGRFVCGWLCPFGWIQELLHKIPFPKKIKTFRWDKYLRFLKYGILLIFVILLPLFLVDIVGQGSPYFCKWICPVGTLEGGIPLVMINESLRAAVGWLYTWKMTILIILIVLSILIDRPFCKYLCPLGAVYSLFNPISMFRYQVDKKKCTACGKCAVTCPMSIEPYKTPNHLECIRCGKCSQACSSDALHIVFCGKTRVNPMEKRNLQR